MMNAPSEVELRQLRELHINIVMPKKPEEKAKQAGEEKEKPAEAGK